MAIFFYIKTERIEMFCIVSTVSFLIVPFLYRYPLTNECTNTFNSFELCWIQNILFFFKLRFMFNLQRQFNPTYKKYNNFNCVILSILSQIWYMIINEKNKTIDLITFIKFYLYRSEGFTWNSWMMNDLFSISCEWIQKI